MARSPIRRPSRMHDPEVPADYQPTKAELEERVTVPGATPDDLLRAVMENQRSRVPHSESLPQGGALRFTRVGRE